MSAYSVSVARRVSIALGSQPEPATRNISGGYWGYSVPEAEPNIRINCRLDDYPADGGEQCSRGVDKYSK